MNKRLSCPYFERGSCRSCSLLSEPGAFPHARKEKALHALIERDLGPRIAVAELWRPSSVFPSRTKAKLSVSGSVVKPVIGLLSTELLECPLHLPELNAVLATTQGLISQYGLTPYDVGTRQGELKGLILKANSNGSEILFRFILRSRMLIAQVREATRELQASHPEVKVISANLQPIPHAILEGEIEILLTEQAFVRENFDSFILTFAPQSFSQVTHETARALYQHVATHFKAAPAEGLLDLFCGVGGFTFAAAPHVKWSLGLEISKQAIECAKKGAQLNGVLNAKFEDGDVENFLKLYTGPAPEVILVNPPRRGLSLGILDSIVRLAPSRVIYSSCNPATWVRDLKLLLPHYQVRSIAPFDMFPLTEHLEVVAILERH